MSSPLPKAAEYKIALFLPSLVGGGAERVMVNLANGISLRGFNVDLVLAHAEGPYLSDVTPAVQIVDLGVKRVVSSLPGLVRYLRRERPDALISGLNHANVIALWAKQWAGVATRVVVTEHNMFSVLKTGHKSMARKSAPLLLTMKHTYKQAERVVAVSSGVANDIARVVNLPRDRVEVIFNPVLSERLYEKAAQPLTHPWFTPDAPPVIVAVGRLQAAKDFPNLIRAVKRLRQDIEARLIILGEGSDRPELEALISELDLQDSVALLGFVDNPYPYMKHANLFALSSTTEGLPTVLIEALALGTPVVATDCQSGPREILADGKYGTLVPIQDAEALAQALHDGLTMPTQRPSEAALYPYTEKAAIDAYLTASGIPTQTEGA